MFLDYPGDHTKFVIAKSAGLGDSDRVKPELRVRAAFLDMDVGRLIPLQGEEEKAVPSDSQYCRHMDILFPAQSRVNHSFILIGSKPRGGDWIQAVCASPCKRDTL